LVSKVPDFQKGAFPGESLAPNFQGARPRPPSGERGPAPAC
jgi:hypothetical protein